MGEPNRGSTLKDDNRKRPDNLKTAFTRIRDFFGVRNGWFHPGSRLVLDPNKSASQLKPTSSSTLDTEDTEDDFFSLDSLSPITDSYNPAGDACVPTQAKRMRHSKDLCTGVQENQWPAEKTFVDLLELNTERESNSYRHAVSGKAKLPPLSDPGINNHGSNPPVSDASDVHDNHTTETTFDSDSEPGSEGCQSNIRQIIEQLSAEEDESAPSVENNGESRNRIFPEVGNKSVSMAAGENTKLGAVRARNVKQTHIESGQAWESSDDTSHTSGESEALHNGGGTVSKTLEWMFVKGNPGYVTEGINQMQNSSEAMEADSCEEEDSAGRSPGSDSSEGIRGAGVVFSLVTRWEPGRVGMGRLWAKQTVVPGRCRTVELGRVASCGDSNGEMSARPDEEMSLCPDSEMSARLDEEMSGRPDEEMLGRSDEEMSSRPDSEMSAHLDEGMSVRPDKEMSALPDEEMSGCSDEEMSSRPDSEMAARPDEEMSGRPDEEMLARPDDDAIEHADETDTLATLDATNDPRVSPAVMAGHVVLSTKHASGSAVPMTTLDDVVIHLGPLGKVSVHTTNNADRASVPNKMIPVLASPPASETYFSSCVLEVQISADINREWDQTPTVVTCGFTGGEDRQELCRLPDGLCNEEIPLRSKSIGTDDKCDTSGHEPMRTHEGGDELPEEAKQVLQCVGGVKEEQPRSSAEDTSCHGDVCESNAGAAMTQFTSRRSHTLGQGFRHIQTSDVACQMDLAPVQMDGIIDLVSSDEEVNVGVGRIKKCCSNRHTGDRRAYTQQEDTSIRDYMSLRDRHLFTSKRYLWRSMQARNIVPGRSWQSLRNHYKSHIVPH